MAGKEDMLDFWHINQKRAYGRARAFCFPKEEDAGPRPSHTHTRCHDVKSPPKTQIQSSN